jgi:hypothetical protein
MELPPQERFTLEELTDRHGWAPHYVQQLLCDDLKFTHIIMVKGEDTRHIYFNKDLWIKTYGDKVTLDPASQEKTFEEDVKLHRATLEKEHGAKHGARWEKEFRAAWEKEHGGKITFNPATLRKQYEKLYKTFLAIGLNEVAILWEPPYPSEKWTRPEGWTIFIPREALNAVKKDGFQDKSNGQNAKKKIPWDPSGIKPEEWYSTSKLAGYLGLDLKGLQNRLAEDKEFRKMFGGRKKKNKRWEYNGRAMLEYLKPHQGN